MPTVVTKTIKPAGGGDYTTLAAWAVARARDCVAADVIERAECYGGGNLGPSPVEFDTDGWVMDGSRYAEITAADGHAHCGFWDTSRAYFECSSSTAISAGAIGRDHVRISKMQISSNGKMNSTIAGLTSGAGGMFVDRCLLKSTHATGYGGFSDVGVISNTVLYNYANPDVGAVRLWESARAINCTVVSCGRAIHAFGASAEAKNCIAQNCADGFSGTFSPDSDYNVSDIAGDAPGAHSKTGVVQFADAAAKDYHLSPADTLARGAGDNLTASGITTDIDGDARPATGAWDIGADQVVESPTPTPDGGRKRFGVVRKRFGTQGWVN